MIFIPVFDIFIMGKVLDVYFYLSYIVTDFIILLIM